MKKKVNCWEFKKCGRAQGGEKVEELGVCPASIETRLDGVYEGVNAGRTCWVVAGSMCGGTIQGTFAHKYANCAKCDFFLEVATEENCTLKATAELVKFLE